MCFIFSLVPATIFVTIGYFVLFSSVKIEGAMQTFARILAINLTLQWVASLGSVLSVASTISFSFSSVILGKRPGRETSFNIASIPFS